MDRRTLLRLMLAAAAAEVVDFEQLLWVPKPIVTVSALPSNSYISMIRLDSELTNITLAYLRACKQLGYMADQCFPVRYSTIDGVWDDGQT